MMVTRILIVEDDHLSRRLMQELCRSLGHDCEVVTNGEQCLERLNAAAADFDLILMDLHMPRVSGLGVIEAIRSNTASPASSLPVIAVTADVNWHDRDRYLAAGFDFLLPKPIELAKLRAAVETFATQRPASGESPRRAAGVS